MSEAYRIEISGDLIKAIRQEIKQKKNWEEARTAGKSWNERGEQLEGIKELRANIGYEVCRIIEECPF